MNRERARDSGTGNGSLTGPGNTSRSRLLQRQDNFFSPITSSYSQSAVNRRMSLSNPKSMVRSPEKPEMSNERKKRRLSLVPNGNSLKLGAPRHANQTPASKRQSLLSNASAYTLNNTGTQVSSRKSTIPNTPSSARNTPTGRSVQNLVQSSITRSNLPTRRTNNRRESVQLPSLSGNITTSSSNRLYNGRKLRDPRPLKSHRFIENAQNELYEYLSSNKFDIDMRCQLSIKTLSQPTQKDFELIFQWLYKKLDPGYKFSRPSENEFYTLLKFLEYPYLETITKSQLSAVGSNWPAFLGMLHWMLRLVKDSLKLDELDIDSIQDSQSQSQSQSQSHNAYSDERFDDLLITSEQSILNKLFISYALKSYKAFLAFGDDDYSEYFDEMNNEYAEYAEEIKRKCSLNKELYNNLRETYDNLVENLDLYDFQLKRGEALKVDVTNLQRHIEMFKDHQQKWQNTLDKLKLDLQNVNESINNSRREKQNIISDLESKGLTLKDIEDLHNEKDKLTDSLNHIDQTQKEIKIKIEEKNKELKSLFFETEAKINTYNQMIYRIFGFLNIPTLPQSSEYIINQINDGCLKSNLGCPPNDIIPQLSTLRSPLENLRLSIQTNTRSNQDSAFQLRQQIDDLNHSAMRFTNQLETLTDDVLLSDKKYAEVRERLEVDSGRMLLDIEEREDEIRNFTLEKERQKMLVERSWRNTEKDFKEFVERIKQRRTNLFVDITKTLDDVVNFKFDIGTELENIVNEVNNELKEHVDSSSVNHIDINRQDIAEEENDREEET